MTGSGLQADVRCDWHERLLSGQSGLSFDDRGCAYDKGVRGRNRFEVPVATYERSLTQSERELLKSHSTADEKKECLKAFGAITVMLTMVVWLALIYSFKLLSWAFEWRVSEELLWWILGLSALLSKAYTAKLTITD